MSGRVSAIMEIAAHLKKLTVVIPTYNERDNILNLIKDVLHYHVTSYTTDVLVVDDSSPDGTGEVVKNLQRNCPNVHLLEGKKEGLGVAYQRGYEYALNRLQPDIVVGMDADYSHDPSIIPKLIQEIEEGNDIAIGSRYTSGGAIPEDWSLLRRLNSKVGNLVARYLGGLTVITDCTGAYRAIKAEFLEKLNLKYVGAKGYVFLVGILHLALKHQARIAEVPIRFKERVYGESKLKLKDILEFISYCFGLLLKTFPISFYILLTLSVIVGMLLLAAGELHLSMFMTFIITGIASIMLVMGMFNVILMIYAWEDAEAVDKNGSPEVYEPPFYSFSAIIPARHEAGVIGETLQAISNLKYPADLVEAIVVCRKDDEATIAAVRAAQAKFKKKNLKLLIFEDEPINKPHALNLGFAKSKGDIVAIFDAEDQPHPDIYQIINTTLLNNQETDVVQSGVQLINYNSRWFSLFNVLEYYFWFKSSLHFFAAQGIVPLGGNTVFMKRRVVEDIGGWDEACLTEDADIGIRLSAARAKVQVVYDQRHATLEETPASISSFIKQRSRWIQGFIQILLKGDWLYLATFHQKFYALYVLIVPLLQILTIIILPFAMLSALSLKLPVLATLFTFIPFLILISQYIVMNIGFYEFTRDYGVRYSLLSPLKLLLFFFPYQLLLNVSAVRAIFRELQGNGHWEKTKHYNHHRQPRTEVVKDPVLAYDR